jgi:hypothetical protein
MIAPGIGAPAVGVAGSSVAAPISGPSTLLTFATSTFTMGYPANPQAGDYAFFWVAWTDNGGLSISSGPTGFTLLASTFSGVVHCALYYRKLDGTESGNVTLTLTGPTGSNNNAYGSLTYWTGVTPSSTFYDGGTIQGANGSANGLGTALTPTVPNQTVITFWGLDTAGASDRNSSPDVGWTNLVGDTWAQPGGSGDSGKAPVDYLISAGGTIAAEARTMNTSSFTRWVSCTIGLRPA